MFEFANAHQNEAKLFTVQHFFDESIPKSTIYDKLKRKENGLPYPTSKWSRNKSEKKKPTKKVKRLQSMIDHNDKLSQRQLASKLNVSQLLYIKKILSKKTTIVVRKKKDSEVFRSTKSND